MKNILNIPQKNDLEFSAIEPALSQELGGEFRTGQVPSPHPAMRKKRKTVKQKLVIIVQNYINYKRTLYIYVKEISIDLQIS